MPVELCGRLGAELGGAMVADSALPGLRAPALAVALALTFATPRTAGAQQPDRQSMGTFSIDRTEVTIRAFTAFANATGLVTEAERAGGGFEWAGGWTRRPGWTFRTPYGAPPSRACLRLNWLC